MLIFSFILLLIGNTVLHIATYGGNTDLVRYFCLTKSQYKHSGLGVKFNIEFCIKVYIFFGGLGWYNSIDACIQDWRVRSG